MEGREILVRQGKPMKIYYAIKLVVVGLVFLATAYKIIKKETKQSTGG